ncbi:hypothetical protein Knedl_CDS0017 [Pseudomonas phage Knedl]|nr:hypothetical protein Knedl_CDS0017 [Pseudomonas phage Knedl]
MKNPFLPPPFYYLTIYHPPPYLGFALNIILLLRRTKIILFSTLLCPGTCPGLPGLHGCMRWCVLCWYVLACAWFCSSQGNMP